MEPYLELLLKSAMLIRVLFYIDIQYYKISEINVTYLFSPVLLILFLTDFFTILTINFFPTTYPLVGDKHIACYSVISN